MGRHGRSTNGPRRSAYHADGKSKHLERKIAEIEDRFILPTTTAPRRPEGVSLFDQPLSSARRSEASPKPKHPNADAIEGKSAAALRTAYKQAFGKDPGQMGKQRLKEAFLRPGAPPFGEEAAARGL